MKENLKTKYIMKLTHHTLYNYNYYLILDSNYVVLDELWENSIHMINMGEKDTPIAEGIIIINNNNIFPFIS